MTCPNCKAETDEPVCPTCRHELRTDLDEIRRLYASLEDAALANSYKGEHEGGPPLGGEPMVMLGPVSIGRIVALVDATPTEILTAWEIRIGHELGRPRDLKPADLTRACDYLERTLPDLLRVERWPWANMIGAIHSIRLRMENVVRDGLRDEPGAPCPDCSAAMVRRVDPRHGLLDQWECSLCYRTLKTSDYYAHVLYLYRQNAPALSAEELEDETGVPAARIRVWGSKGYVRKHGRDHAGRQLYNAAEVRARAEPAKNLTDEIGGVTA